MDFSIITPSFRQPTWLRLCLRSVADQATSGREGGHAISVVHVVQDACSGEAVRAVCAEFPGVELFQEPDAGMYDAVNRGLRRTTGEICAYLNCDEQYLPGALSAVADFFATHPDIDVVFGDVVVVDDRGEYVCSRQVLTPHYNHTQTCQLNTFTAATFFRRRILDHEDLFFDPTWKSPGDAAWVLAMLRRKIRMAVMRQYLSAFTDSGTNLAMTADGLRDHRKLQMTAPPWVRMLAPLWIAIHRARRFAAGFYWPAPFDYDLYTLQQPSRRTHFTVRTPTAYWRRRLATRA